MPAIFYDLETSDRNPLGQILNYSFMVVDDQLEVLRELSGNIRIERLQWPSPSAIVANRIDVLQHRTQPYPSERDAMAGIARFIAQAIEEAAGAKLPLIGFNSSKFDLGYLRTSFIRNGINPYFGGKLRYRDLFHGVRKLASLHHEFPRGARAGAESTGRISLALEHLCHEFKLLEGAQLHESRADVLLTIALARLLRERFCFDILTYDGYEASPLHGSDRRNEVAYLCEPAYALETKERAEIRPVVLLEGTPSAALWIDLLQFEEGRGRDAVRWVGVNKDQFMVAPPNVASRRWEGGRERFDRLATRAREEFKGLTTKNFFAPTVCDIEQDIYRLDFDAINALHQAIWEGEERALRAHPNSDVRVVFQRYKLNTYSWGGSYDEKVRERLRKYALHRYGGRMNIAKSEAAREYAPPADPRHFHPSYTELLKEMEARAQEREGNQRLMESLRQFYHESDLWQVAGTELATIPPRAPLLASKSPVEERGPPNVAVGAD